MENRRIFKVVGGEAETILNRYKKERERVQKATRALMKKHGAISGIRIDRERLLCLTFEKGKADSRKLTDAGLCPISAKDVDRWNLGGKDNIGKHDYWKPNCKNALGKLVYEDFANLAVDDRDYASQMLGRNSGDKYGDWYCDSGAMHYAILYPAAPGNTPITKATWIVSHHKNAKIAPVDGLVEIKLSEYYQIIGK